jgi:hypothetical protein
MGSGELKSDRWYVHPLLTVAWAVCVKATVKAMKMKDDATSHCELRSQNRTASGSSQEHVQAPSQSPSTKIKINQNLSPQIKHADLAATLVPPVPGTHHTTTRRVCACVRACVQGLLIEELPDYTKSFRSCASTC